jgi:hypothetical protein
MSFGKKLAVGIRWYLLINAIVMALLSLLTAVKCPVWLAWLAGMVFSEGWVVGLVITECALWLTAATVLRRRGLASAPQASYHHWGDAGPICCRTGAAAQARSASVAAGARPAGSA